MLRGTPESMSGNVAAARANPLKSRRKASSWIANSTPWRSSSSARASSRGFSVQSTAFGIDAVRARLVSLPCIVHAFQFRWHT